MESLNDKILFMIAIFAVLSIFTGMIYAPATGWIEGISILFALFILVLITSINDYSKDKTFVRLQGYARDESLPTVRGKLGSMQNVNIWEMVVGDVVQLSAGDKVPADCIIIDGAKMRVDQSHLPRDEADDIDDDGTATDKGEFDPFLYADSFIKNGSGKVLVTCVGRHCTRGVVDKKLDTSTKTPLENKLFNLSKTFTFIGVIAALVILATSLIMLVLGTGFSDSDKKGALFLKKLIEMLTLTLIIVIVAIPEGLPMTVGISLSYSVIDMYQKDKILVRKLTAPEKLGEITEILMGKTGTMTSEEMEVISCFAQNVHINMFRKNTILNCAFNEATIDLLKESICYNTQAHIEMDDNAFYVPEGNGTEVSLIKWLQGAEISVHKVMLEREGRIRAWIPFDTTLKRSIIAVEHPLVQDTVRVYIKGAPEVVIEKCNACFDQNGNKVPLDQYMQQYYLTNIMKDSMTLKGFRAMTFAYKDIPTSEFAKLSDFHSPHTMEMLESQSTFVGMVALKDPLRPRVSQVLQYAEKGGMTVRMISGDNLDTAKALAVDAGIITKDQFSNENPIEEQRRYAMDAKDFREQCGPLNEHEDAEGNISYSLGNQQRFNQIIETLKVLGRAGPEDKLLVTTGLQQMDVPRKVAVVGDGLNDLPAIKVADVSFAMGSGKSISRNAASIVLCKNDIESVMKSVQWGRNIYCNIKKFLQFQVTCNLACLLTILVGVIFLTESPLNATMLIWINMVMDTLGAIALATAPPLASVINQPAITGDVKILNGAIWRNIYGVALYQCVIMFLMIWFGRSMFDLDYEKDTQTTDRCPKDDITGERPDTCDELTMATNKKTHLTIIFTTFVFLQFWNYINCRVIGADEYNIFRKFFNSIPFLVVLAVVYFVQWSACEWFTFVFETETLTGEQFGQCVLIGSTILVAAFALKLSPAHWVEKMPVQIDEDEVMGGDTAIMSHYDKHAVGKATDLRQGMNYDDEGTSLNARTRDDDDYHQA